MGSMPTQREPRRDDESREEHDHLTPGYGGGAVLFSHAPDLGPGAEEGAGPSGAGQTGWPWFLPQDGLPREDLLSTLDAAQEPVAVAADLAQIPLVRRAVRLLELVGEGRGLSAEGELSLADVRTVLETETPEAELDDQELTSMWQVPAIAGPWNALVSGGWLMLTSTRVLPGDGVTPAASQSEDPEAFLRFSQALILLLVHDALQRSPEDGGLFGDPDLFAALTHTVVAGGLELPATLRVALDRGLVPEDPAGDPDMDEIQRYWRTDRDLAALAAHGLLHRETTPDGQDTLHRGTPEVIAEIFGALEMGGDLEGAP